MTNTQPSLRSDYCPICAGIGVRQLLESVSDFIGIRRWRKRAELRVLAGPIVETASQLPNEAAARLTRKGLIHGLAAAEVEKIAWREDPTAIAGFHPLKDFIINRLRVLSHSTFDRKTM